MGSITFKVLQESMESEVPKLFTYYRSSCSWRVRIALNMAGLTVEHIPVHLVNNGGEQHSETYKSINPMEQVPTLKINGLTQTQSMAIMEYIHDLHPEAGILPSKPEPQGGGQDDLRDDILGYPANSEPLSDETPQQG